MPFEDLLGKVEVLKCKTCIFIRALPPELQSEVDAAMAKAKYNDAELTRGLAHVAAQATSGTPPKRESVKFHRTSQHRLPS